MHKVSLCRKEEKPCGIKLVNIIKGLEKGWIQESFKYELKPVKTNDMV